MGKMSMVVPLQEVNGKGCSPDVERNTQMILELQQKLTQYQENQEKMNKEIEALKARGDSRTLKFGAGGGFAVGAVIGAGGGAAIAVAGAKAGAVAGGFAGLPAGPPGIAAGAAAGAVIGGLVGAGIGAACAKGGCVIEKKIAKRKERKAQEEEDAQQSKIIP